MLSEMTSNDYENVKR